MKRGTKILAFAAVLAIMLAGSGRAQDPAPAQTEESRMPGPQHKILAAFEGNWNNTVLFWPDASVTEPYQSKGKNTNYWVLGGRFLYQESRGAPIQGNEDKLESIGITGYDSAAAAYVSTRMDNRGTGMKISTGTYDATRRTIYETGTINLPEGKKADFRAEWHSVDSDRYTYELFLKGPDGKEYPSLQIVYDKQPVNP
ncbi:MAG TPA: DUF1579 family protein [Verrucomicrobiae bacterium]|jgi:hypothetical protein|nr:DUF1579 family protein [Verrucomicrobiae bacterium]